MCSKMIRWWLIRVWIVATVQLKPAAGGEYHYSTHGYTIVAAVCEGAAGGVDFGKQLMKMTEQLGMHQTFVEKNDELIRNRSK
jgi:CubicO group peptidase (beta-lactamase class C family)